MAHRLAEQFEAVERMNRGQNMGRIGALSTTSLDQALVAQEGQQRVEEEPFSLARDQSSAELTQDRGIKARILKREGEGMSGSQGAFRFPSPLRTGRAPLNASGSSKPYAARINAPFSVSPWLEWICSWQIW